MVSGVTTPLTAALRRPKITLATRPLSCWNTMDLTRRLEIRLAKLDTIIANPFDNGGEHRVAGAEVVYGLLHLETLARRSASPLLYRHANTHFALHLAASCWRRSPLPSIKVDVDLVSILTSVRDKRGALIPSLQKEDFTILEDGKPQPIKYFTKETDLPLTIGLLVDVSGSQRNLIDIERSAASQFFREVLRKKDLAFLISFGEETELLQDYTGSPAAPDRRAGPIARHRPA